MHLTIALHDQSDDLYAACLAIEALLISSVLTITASSLIPIDQVVGLGAPKPRHQQPTP
jgi:hypothetical protein